MKKESFKIIIITSVLIQFMLLLVFIWHIEISTEFIDDVYFTNGFKDAEPIKIYHFQMYCLIIFTFLNAMYILYNLDKVANEVEK